MTTRQPIVATLGHVDHGKTTLLDKIRGSTVAKREAGAITQHIGASEIPIDAVKKLCGTMLEKMGITLTIPGLLMVDTPGHEAFTNLRKRGGSISDLAILVVDINEGFKAQTREALGILRQFKVPFIVAANKIDLISGWRSTDNLCFAKSFAEQREEVKAELDEKLYKLVISLADAGINSERFDRIDDYTKQVAIIPTSGVTGEGIAELLMVLSGLAQRFLEKELKTEVSGPAKGAILEVKEEKGLGKTIDVVIYDGTLNAGDTIVVAGIDEPIVTKVRAIMKPSPLKELREKSKFEYVKSVSAAAGIKISAPDLDKAVAGMSLIVANKKKEQEEAIKMLKEEVKEIVRTGEEEGIIIKADSVGALEALNGLMKKAEVPIRRTGIGDVTHTDVAEAQNIAASKPLLGVVFAFNVKIPKEVELMAHDNNVKIFSAPIVYTIFEDYLAWKNQSILDDKKKALERLIWPGKVKILSGYVFRQNNPAIFGVEVLAGRIKTGARLLRKDGKEIGEIGNIQLDKEKISEADTGQKVALSVQGPTIGRQINEGDELIVFIPKSHLEIIESKFLKELTAEEKELIEFIKSHQK